MYFCKIFFLHRYGLQKQNIPLRRLDYIMRMEMVPAFVFLPRFYTEIRINQYCFLCAFPVLLFVLHECMCSLGILYEFWLVFLSSFSFCTHMGELASFCCLFFVLSLFIQPRNKRRGRT